MGSGWAAEEKGTVPTPVEHGLLQPLLFKILRRGKEKRNRGKGFDITSLTLATLILLSRQNGVG